MKPTNFLLTRSKFLRTILRRPLLAELGMTLRTELQSTRDLLNFDSTRPLAGMYHDERKASLIQAGAGLLTAAASVVFPPLALASPATLYSSYKAAELFRPVAFTIGAAIGLAGTLYLKQPEAMPEPGLMPPAPASTPAAPEKPGVTSLAATPSVLSRA